MIDFKIQKIMSLAIYNLLFLKMIQYDLLFKKKYQVCQYEKHYTIFFLAHFKGMLTPVHFEQSDTFQASHLELFHGSFSSYYVKVCYLCSFKMIVGISKKFLTFDLIIISHKAILLVPQKVLRNKFRDVIIDAVVLRRDIFLVATYKKN